MIIDVGTVRGMIMEMNNRSFDDIIEDYGAAWFRAGIVDAENICSLFAEWCKDADSIGALDSLIDDMNRSDTTFYAVL